MKRIIQTAQIVLPVTAVVLVVIQVIVSNQLATLGKKMGNLDTAVADARDVNEILHTEVASASSLMAVRLRAQAMGFHEPTSKQITSLTPAVPVAFGVSSN